MYNDRNGKSNAIEMRQDEKKFVLMNIHAPVEEKGKKRVLCKYQKYNRRMDVSNYCRGFQYRL